MTVRRISAIEVASSARRVTRLLEDLGVPLGGGVALLGANTPELLAVFRGAVWSGRYFTAISWRWTAQDVAYVAGNCEAGALFADARWPHLAAFLGDADCCVVGVPDDEWGEHVHALEAACLYEAGWSSGRLDERFDLSADTVLKALRRAGVPIRSRRGGPGPKKAD